jgi:hypothetical protein
MRVVHAIDPVVAQLRSQLSPGNAIQVTGQIDSMNGAFHDMGVGLLFAAVFVYLWQIDPVMLPFHTAVRSGRFAGCAGPSRRPAAEAISKYILVDMYAKAVQGMAPEDAVKWRRASWSKFMPNRLSAF